MKKKIIATLGVGIILGSIAPATTFAAKKNVKSTGDVGFKVNTDKELDILKPGTNEPIEIVEGGNNRTPGAIQIMHVPNFNFGVENELEINTANYAAFHEKYVLKSDKDKKAYVIPQFVQVGDISGDNSGAVKWDLSVDQDSKFKTEGHELENSRIQIYDQTLTNNVRNENVLKMVKGINLSEGKAITIPLKSDATGAVNVLSSLSGNGVDSTNGTISSNVFKKDYKESDYGETSKLKETDRNQSIKLNVPQSDSALAKKYTADLTWTLTTTP